MRCFFYRRGCRGSCGHGILCIFTVALRHLSTINEAYSLIRERQRAHSIVDTGQRDRTTVVLRCERDVVARSLRPVARECIDLGDHGRVLRNPVRIDFAEASIQAHQDF